MFTATLRTERAPFVNVLTSCDWFGARSRDSFHPVRVWGRDRSMTAHETPRVKPVFGIQCKATGPQYSKYTIAFLHLAGHSFDTCVYLPSSRAVGTSAPNCPKTPKMLKPLVIECQDIGIWAYHKTPVLVSGYFMN